MILITTIKREVEDNSIEVERLADGEDGGKTQYFALEGSKPDYERVINDTLNYMIDNNYALKTSFVSCGKLIITGECEG